MNAVEIEAAVTELVRRPFDAVEFPFDFLAAFGNKDTTIAKLRKGVSNASDIPGGVLQRNNIHLAVAKPGEVHEILTALKQSPETAKAKAKFILATDGDTIQAEELITGDPLVCEYEKLDDHFGFFLPLAGITTVKEIKDNPIDIRATSRLNKLYVELLKDNPEWATAERRPDLNHFLARLIFCFFAEDTNIFHGDGLFTQTIKQMTEASGNDTHLVLEQIFGAMAVRAVNRANSDLPNYANQFPYVNGGLFSGSTQTPKFSRIARSYLIRAGELNWREINPDIFGSMIQAVADDAERGSLGMHYTSVPNILKVLNPLFLDDLREQLERAGEHNQSLLKLRERMSRIRVFDPACGSGNFLVIAYKEMRAIEYKINQLRGEIDRPSEIHLTNFRGIEIRDFAAEVARLALIIAEFQCDVKHRGPKLALAEFLPLDSKNWIVCDNALRLNWASVCPPFGSSVKLQGDDLFSTPLVQSEIDFVNTGGETYICGNPPYLGSTWQTASQKDDLKRVFGHADPLWKLLDYVAGWFYKAAQYGKQASSATAFVTTNSLCQGQQVSALWPKILRSGHKIVFAHTSFKWSNLAKHNAGVTVAIVGITTSARAVHRIYHEDKNGQTLALECAEISPYLVPGKTSIVSKRSAPVSQVASMDFGNKPTDGGALLLARDDVSELGLDKDQTARFVRRIYGSAEFIRGLSRYCIWIEDADLLEAMSIDSLDRRIESVRRMRLESRKLPTINLALYPHRFGEIRPMSREHSIVVPSVSSESREYLPCGLLPAGSIVSNLAFALHDASLWNMALIASRLHLVWVGTVCGKLETRYRYSNTLGWNTFPVPTLTEQNKADLTRCAEEILLARERHFPKTIADLYDPEQMPEDLRAAHEKNDETLERIYIGRRFKNDTERLEKLFEMYTKMTGPENVTKGVKTRKKQSQMVVPQLAD